MTENIPAKVVYGNKVRANNNDVSIFSKAWEEFLKKQVKGDIYAVYSNYESDYTGDFDFMIGTEQTSGEHSITIGNDEYYIWEVESNDLAGVGKAWSEIWKSDLRRAYTTDFEIYKTDGSITIYLSINANP
ncbi:effector binding domain-containing protein [Psychrobacillus sp. NEAU-3TGS]|uniref:GyrI-like domain-containing protein n=1 Tax=Psychrobacillus sp. NEAU-3TGS TaxID=2995412 RepID=UPI0024975E79|nr:effector binding domain-containing protein [Psychrobacillus sp. NEAU-3TGS]MDI2586997.1 effector binding domain-containing protein [Psychrobacillus sp. NEAU-3TGS]